MAWWWKIGRYSRRTQSIGAGLLAASMAGFSLAANAQTPTGIDPIDTADTEITVGADETITASGKPVHGVRSTGDGAVITVDGAIEVETNDLMEPPAGPESNGILSTGVTPEITVTADGAISATGNFANGIQSTGGRAVITVYGQITTTGSNSFGIVARTGAAPRMTVDGMISTNGMRAHGIASDVDDTEISVGGRILTDGFLDSETEADVRAHGIIAAGANADIRVTGTIETRGQRSHGINSQGASARITMMGRIETTRGRSHGIVSQGADAGIRATGTIQTAGEASIGIASAGDRAVITADGTIRTTGTGAHGIQSTGADVRIMMGSLIETSQQNSAGIVSAGADAEISVGGTIRTEGADAFGMFSQGADAEISVDGTIRTEGAGAHGMFAQGADADITVAGTVRTAGMGAHGIRTAGDGGTITVSGGIHSTGAGSYAVFGEGAQTLRLRRGWAISGPVMLQANQMNRLEMETGYPDMSRTIHVPNLESAEISGGGMMLRIDDEMFAVLDPSASAMQRIALAHVVQAFHRAVHERGAMARTAPADVEGSAPLTGRRAWGGAFGGGLKRGVDGLALGWDGLFLGVVAGGEGALRNGMRLGVLGGYARSETATTLASAEVETDVGVLGVYGELGDASESGGTWALTGALIGGYTDQDTTRLVQDNVAGLQKARGSADGWFLSPSLGLRFAHRVGERIELRPSIRASGVFARHGSCPEGGADITGLPGNNVVYDSGTSLSTHGRAQLGLAIRIGPSAEFEARAGAMARMHSGDRVKARLRSGGESVSYDILGDESAFGGFAGGRLSWALDSGLSLHADVEYSHFSGDESALTGRLTLTASF